jgi:bifunctional DNase/RNase
MKPGLGAVKSLWFLSVLLLSMGCGDSTQTERGQVRVQVANIGLDRETGAHYVVLEDRPGKRTLPIMIGEEEARAIMLELRRITPERPLTYELLRNIIQQTGNHVDRVVIGEVRDQVYYAKIYLDRGRYRIDSRPSDAIALAVGVDAPIYVADKLFGAQQINPGISAVLNTANGLGITVQELTPALAQYFGVDANSGVVVADFGPTAAKAGIERGDIITEIGGQQVRTPDEFSHSAGVASAGVNPKVTLTMRRGDIRRAITMELSPDKTSGR